MVWEAVRQLAAEVCREESPQIQFFSIKPKTPPVSDPCLSSRLSPLTDFFIVHRPRKKKKKKKE